MNKKIVIYTVSSIILGFFSCAGAPETVTEHESLKVASSEPLYAESIREVIYLTRELKIDQSYVYLKTNKHTEQIADLEVAEFFSRYPDLNGSIQESDYRFLLQIVQDNESFDLLMDSKSMISAIMKRLTELEHVFSSFGDRSGYEETPDQIYILNPIDQLKVYLLLEALSSSAVSYRIGLMLVADMENPQMEYGGIIKYTNHSGFKIAYETFPSKSFSDHEYNPESEVFNPGYMAIWHNHAARDPSVPISEVDNSYMAGPSGTLRGSLVSVGGDLWQYFINGIDGIVITPTGNRTFNLDFVTSEGAVIDLGKYSYRLNNYYFLSEMP